MRGERWGGLHPILGSCSFGRFDLHNLFPLRAEPPLTIFQYRSSTPELAGGKIPLCVILPPKNRRGGAMEQATRNGRFRASFPSFYLLSTPRSSSRGRPASTAAGRETHQGRSKNSYADRARRSDRADRGSRGRTVYRSGEDRDTDVEGFIFFPTHPTSGNLRNAGFTLIYEPIA